MAAAGVVGSRKKQSSTPLLRQPPCKRVCIQPAACMCELHQETLCQPAHEEKRYAYARQPEVSFHFNSTRNCQQRVTEGRMTIWRGAGESQSSSAWSQVRTVRRLGGEWGVGGLGGSRGSEGGGGHSSSPSQPKKTCCVVNIYAVLFVCICTSV